MTRIPNQFNVPFRIAQIFRSPIRRRIRGCHSARLLLGIGPLDKAECPQGGAAASLPRLAANGGASLAADAATASLPAVAAAAVVSAPASAPELAASAGGGAAAMANSSATLVDGLEDNGALAGGAPSGQDLSHHLLSGGMATYIQLDTSRKHKRRKAWHEFNRWRSSLRRRWLR
jgi:hypothetical protein